MHGKQHGLTYRESFPSLQSRQSPRLLKLRRIAPPHFSQPLALTDVQVGIVVDWISDRGSSGRLVNVEFVDGGADQRCDDGDAD